MTEERTTCWVRCEIEPVPKDIRGQEWHKWRQEHHMDPVAQSADENRGAWISSLSTYLRGVDYLLYMDGSLIDVVDTHELKGPQFNRDENDEEILRARAQGREQFKKLLFAPTFVQGHCFPQGHICVTTTTSETPVPISTCVRCGFTVELHPPS